MAAESRQRLMLGAALAGLALVGWWQFAGSTPPAAAVRRPPVPRPTGPAALAPSQVLAEGVGLQRLAEDRPAPADGGRDPFRGGAAAPSGNGSGGGVGGGRPVTPVAPPPPAMPEGPPPPPPVPPITVKFIGVVSRADVGRVAVLSDGKNVYYGRAGEIVDGRWRIVSIGEESLQIEYVDGRGRQTVRLTG